jgi:hypothetical protein
MQSRKTSWKNLKTRWQQRPLRSRRQSLKKLQARDKLLKADSKRHRKTIIATTARDRGHDQSHGYSHVGHQTNTKKGKREKLWKKFRAKLRTTIKSRTVVGARPWKRPELKFIEKSVNKNSYNTWALKNSGRDKAGANKNWKDVTQ